MKYIRCVVPILIILTSCSSSSYKLIDFNERTLRDYVMIYVADPNDDLSVILHDINKYEVIPDTTRFELIHRDQFHRFELVPLPDTLKLVVSDTEKLFYPGRVVRGNVVNSTVIEGGLGVLFEYKGKLIHVYNGSDRLMVKGYLCPSLIYKDGLIYYRKNVDDNP